MPHRLHGKQPVEPRPLADLFHPDARKSGLALSRCQAGGEDFLDFEPAAPIFDAGPGEDQEPWGEEKVIQCPWEEVATWHRCEVEPHWSLKQLWANGLRQVAVGGETGHVHGISLIDRRANVEVGRLAAVNAAGVDPSLPATVLQTYTVSLQQVKKDLALWRPPLQDEYDSLNKVTNAIKPTTEEKLKEDLRFPTMELAPAMLAPTVKSPHGKLQARW